MVARRHAGPPSRAAVRMRTARQRVVLAGSVSARGAAFGRHKRHRALPWLEVDGRARPASGEAKFMITGMRRRGRPRLLNDILFGRPPTSPNIRCGCSRNFDTTDHLTLSMRPALGSTATGYGLAQDPKPQSSGTAPAGPAPFRSAPHRFGANIVLLLTASPTLLDGRGLHKGDAAPPPDLDTDRRSTIELKYRPAQTSCEVQSVDMGALGRERALRRGLADQNRIGAGQATKAEGAAVRELYFVVAGADIRSHGREAIRGQIEVI